MKKIDLPQRPSYLGQVDSESRESSFKKTINNARVLPPKQIDLQGVTKTMNDLSTITPDLSGMTLSSLLNFPPAAEQHTAVSKSCSVKKLFPLDANTPSSENKSGSENGQLEIATSTPKIEESEKSNAVMGEKFELKPVKPPVRQSDQKKRTGHGDKKKSKKGSMNVLSLETQRLLKVMMRSSKLTFHQQEFLDDLVKDGASLPIASEEQPRIGHSLAMDYWGVPRFSPSPSDLEHDFPPVAREKILNGTARPSMRTLDQIAKSGAFQSEPYRPQRKKNSQFEKKRLQTMMEYDGKLPPNALNSDGTIKAEALALLGDDQNISEVKKVNEKIDVEHDEFDMLVKEIEERKEWIDEMEALGKAEPYRKQIQGEIALVLNFNAFGGSLKLMFHHFKRLQRMQQLDKTLRSRE
ncbi:hypothetical protein HK098_006845 [Nowakowskiella sp. JEL0407]|nr:hypothetical protein HK098_006845 [Nowakowskiella sp. JEL0407]